MIKCRTKAIAKKITQILNSNGFKCKFDGYYNVAGFKTEEREKEALKLLSEVWKNGTRI